MKLTWSIIELSLYYGSRRRIFATIGNPSHVVFHTLYSTCVYVYAHAYAHLTCEFLFSSPSDDGKAVQGDLWKVAGVNYKVNRDRTIKEFKFVMDIDCWKLLQHLSFLFIFFSNRLIYRRDFWQPKNFSKWIECPNIRIYVSTLVFFYLEN